MASTSDALHVTPRSRRLLAILFIVSISIAIAAAWSFNHSNAGKSLFSLANLVGPTTASLLHGGGLTACTEAMGTPGNPICFHAGRMPLASLVVALGVSLVGDHYLRVAFFKTILLLLPVELAMYFVWQRMPADPLRRFGVTVLLLAPFAIPAFLACVVNMQVEEGYTYSLLALAVAILLFSSGQDWVQAILFVIALDGLYLAKSAMAPAVVVLLIAYLLMVRRAALRWLALLVVLAAPVGWALYQHHASGRYSIGTSLDGLNLHKGNNADFLNHYPPPRGDTLDRFDQDINQGRRFSDEWSFNDYHLHAAVGYIRHHPHRSLRGGLRKLDVLLFSIRKVGSSQERGTRMVWEVASLAFFRLMLWAAILHALYWVARPSLGGPLLRLTGWVFLALVASCLLPYVAGFAYTRHVSVLIYPAALMCCRLLAAHNHRDGTEMLTG